MQNKSPLVKRLRKAGYSTKQAMEIASTAWELHSTDEQSVDAGIDRAWFNLGQFWGMFDWQRTPQGHKYWLQIDIRME